MIKKIIQISDIHIFLNKSFDAHSYAFNEFYKQLNDEKPDLIVCTGDLIDSKLRLSPEQIDLAQNLIINLTYYCPLIIILGNHDLNLANKDRLDSISPIIHQAYSKCSHPIFFLKHSGVYNIYGIDWAVWSCMDNQKKPTIEKKNFTIGLYHGTVKNCVSENGFVLTEGIDIEDFADCDNVMLGDIHQQQFFRNNEIAYPGSFIQTKVTESTSGNYLIWNWNGQKYIPTPRKIENKYSTKVLKIDEIDHIEFNDTQSYLIKYEPEKISKAEIFELKKKNIGKKISFEAILKKKVFNKKEVSDKVKMISSLADYLDHINCQNKDEIIAIDNEYNANLDLTKDWEYGDFSIISLEMENFLSFGPRQKINFDKNGVFGVSGENKIGKSSALTAIQFCLFNSTKNNSSSGIRKLINKHNRNSPCEVVLNLEKAGKFYKISRRLIPKKAGVSIELDFEENDGGVIRSLKGEKRQETEKEIQKYFGLESSYEMMTLYSEQKRATEFIDCKNSERLSLINKFLGLHYFEIKEKEVGDRIREKKAVYTEITNNLRKYENIEILEQKCKELKDEKISKESELKELSNKLELFIEENSYLLDKYNSLKIFENQSYKEIPEVENAIKNYEIKNVENSLKIKSINDEILIVEDRLGQINLIEPDYNEEYELKLKCFSFKEKKDTLLRQAEIDICNNCGKKLSEDEKKEILKKVDEIDSDLLLASEKLQTVSDIIKKHKEEKLLKTKLSEKKITLLKSIDEVEKTVLRNLVLIENEKKKTREYEEIKKAKNELAKIKPLYENFNNSKNKIEKEISDVKKALIVLQKTISELTHSIIESNKIVLRLKELEAENSLLKQYKDIINKSGLPLFLLKRKLSEINTQINLIVGQIFDFEIEFSVNEESGELNIEFSYPEDVEKDDVGLASGSETFIINLCIKVGLSQISEMPKCTSLLIDEGWGKLDEQNLEKIPNLFRVLPEFYKNIITVSHIEKLKELYQNQIFLKKKGNYTIISQ